MPSSWPAFGPSLLAVTTAIVLAGGGSVRAQGKLEANYVVTLSGFPIGKGR